MRYQSKAMIGDLPVICVAFGPDLQTQQNRGRAAGTQQRIADLSIHSEQLHFRSAVSTQFLRELASRILRCQSIPVAPLAT